VRLGEPARPGTPPELLSSLLVVFGSLDPKLPVRKSVDLHSPSAVGAEYHLGLPCFTTTSTSTICLVVYCVHALTFTTWWFTACCCLLVCGIATPHLVFSCTHIAQAIARHCCCFCLPSMLSQPSRNASVSLVPNGPAEVRGGPGVGPGVGPGGAAP
jgi:hypothetical protein